MALTAIYLDLDGVLVDLCGGIAKVTGVDRSKFYGPLNSHWRGAADVLTHETGEEWDEDRVLGIFEEHGHDFWENLEKYPWADELYDMCRRFAPTVIMTSPAHIPSCASGKMAWIRDNLEDVERFAITPCKHHMSHPGALLIDDSTEGCEKFREYGGDAFLFPQPWSDPHGWASRDALTEIQAILEYMSIS